MDHLRHRLFFAHLSQRDPAILSVLAEPVKVSDLLLLFATRAGSFFSVLKSKKIFTRLFNFSL